MKRASILDLIFLNTYWLGLSFMWNSLHVIILPAVLLNFVPETQKNSYLGLLTFFGLIIAMIVQPISGSISDRWISRWGRRRPLILIGTLVDFLFLAFLGWAGGIIWLAIGYIGLQFSSNVAHGPAQGLLPDQVPNEQLGVGSSYKNLMDMLGMIVASLVMGRVYPPDTLHPIGPVALVAAFLAFGTLFTILGVHEKQNLAKGNPPKNNTTELINLQSISLIFHLHASFWWLVVSRFLFLLGVYGMQAFLQYFVRDVLAVDNPVKLTGDLMAVIALALTAMAFSGGWLGDRFGHRRIQLIASLISGFGCLVMIIARTPQTVLIFGTFLGMGIGLFLTSNWALANRLAPADQAGKFMGLTNIATAGAGAAARLGGPLVDFINNAKPGAFWGYSALFLIGSVLIFVSIVFLMKITNEKSF